MGDKPVEVQVLLAAPNLIFLVIASVSETISSTVFQHTGAGLYL